MDVDQASSEDEDVNARAQADDANRPTPPTQGLQKHENVPHELLSSEETWESEKGNPVRFCTEREIEPRLVVNGTRSWYEWSGSGTRQTHQANKQPVENNDEHLLAIRCAEHNLIALMCLLVLLLTLR
ncbi:hypothetical protein ACROYT_G036385 [Oculina patagonica]